MRGKIIQIRGTSGSGKTTAAVVLRAKLEHEGYREELIKTEGRKQPLLHVFGKFVSPELREFAFLGHYNTPCGGVDTITSRLEAFELARTWSMDTPGIERTVIMEGVIMSDDVNMTIDLAKDNDVIVYHLNTPLEVCLKSIEGRRQAKLKPGQVAKPLNPANTAKRIPAIQRACARLRDAGVQVVDVSRDRLVAKLLELVP